MAEISPFEEWSESEAVLLDNDDLNLLKKINDNKPNARIEIIPEANQYKLRATSWVGTIKTHNHIITIKPKIGNLNFFKMLEYSENLDDIRLLDEVKITSGRSLVDFMAKLFVESVDNILQEGIYKNYNILEEEISTIRGKLLVAKNVRKPRFSQEKFWCEYDELGPDILENQILLYCSKILSELVINDYIKENLDQIQHIFEKEGVSEYVPDLYHLDMIHYQRFNEHYEKILKLCEFILRSTWYGDFSKKDIVPVYGFLYNMNTLFQNFVTKSVQEEFHQFRIKREPSKKKLLQEIPFKEKNTKQVSAKVLKPDIVMCDKKTGKIRLVIDTKYKKDDPTANDFYQSVAYSLAFDCPVLLLFPQLNQRKRGDFELVDELDKSAPIFSRTIDLSESDSDYICVMKSRIKNIIDTILQI